MSKLEAMIEVITALAGDAHAFARIIQITSGYELIMSKLEEMVVAHHWPPSNENAIEVQQPQSSLETKRRCDPRGK